MAVAAKKVMLLPPEFVQALQQKNRIETSALLKVQLELDGEMEKILKSDLPSDDKLRLYNETLQKFVQLNQPKSALK